MKYLVVLRDGENEHVVSVGGCLQDAVDMAKTMIDSGSCNYAKVYKECIEVKEVKETKIKISKLGE